MTGGEDVREDDCDQEQSLSAEGTPDRNPQDPSRCGHLLLRCSCSGTRGEESVSFLPRFLHGIIGLRVHQSPPSRRTMPE